jgi:hypothetical protein
MGMVHGLGICHPDWSRIRAGFTLAVLAAWPVPSPGAPRCDPPRLAFAPAGRVELGELGPLELRVQGYGVQNLSGRPIALRVLDLPPGVGVAGPALARAIPSRASAWLVLRVDPGGSVGPQGRTVRLGTDDPGQGDYELPVHLTVRPDLTVDAPRRSLGDVAVWESPQARFGFQRESGLPLRLWLGAPPPDYLECRISAAGARGELVCTLRPERIRPGMRLGLERLRVESNAPLQPRFGLYLDWRIHRAIEAVPSRLVFPEPGARRLGLQSRDGTPFRILAADLEGEGFRLDPVPQAAAPTQALVVRRDDPGPGSAMLVLCCSGQAEPVRVPVTCVGSEPVPDEGVMVRPELAN